MLRVGEFIKREPGKFGDHVIQRRFKGRASVGKYDLIQRLTDPDLGRDPRDGISTGLACQRRGAGYPGIDLDEVILRRAGIQRELHVAAAFDLQRADDLQGAVPQHLVVFIGEGLRWADHDGIAGVNAHRIHVFHIADGDRGVARVPHYLVFDLFVALYALFDQHLFHRGKLQAVFQQGQQLVFILGKAAAGAAQRKGGAQHHGIADPVRDAPPLFQRTGHFGGQHRLAKGLAQRLELFPVLRSGNGVAFCAQQLHAALPQHALFLQLHGQVQPGLPADAGQQRVRPFKADDPGQVFQRQRLHIDLVRHGSIRHNGSGVGVAQHHLIPLLFQGEAGLGAGVVELRRLPDDDGAGADDQNFMDIRSFRHVSSLLSSGE